MKHWLETRQVLDRLAQLHNEGKRAALATVVRVRGSAYRHEGAKMLVAEDGTTVGNVSGGCLEADVREVARQVINVGLPQMRSYCAGTDEVSAWDLGVGCEGQVEVFIERTLDARRRGRALLDEYAPFAVCTLLSVGPEDARGRRLVVTAFGNEGGLMTPAFDGQVSALASSLLENGVGGIHRIGDHDVFVDVFTPPPRLVVVSAGDDARCLARLAAEVGFRVVVVDRRPALLSPERFPPGVRLIEADAEAVLERLGIGEDAYGVVMTHSYADDREYARALLTTRMPYIGLLGPRQRTARLLRELSASGAGVDERRIYGPVGLDIGTDGAEQVALAVVGEILAVRSGRRPASLRERPTPIHAVPAD